MTGSFFNWVDYSIMGIVVLSMLISFFRGFVREAISLVVWVVGVLVALKFAVPFQAHLPDFISHPLLRYGIAFLLLFVAIFILGICINFLVHLLVDKVGLSVTDRLLGLFFGAARGVIVSAVFLMFINVGHSERDAAVAHSRLATSFSPLVLWLEAFLPEQMRHVSGWVKVPKSVVNGDAVMGGD